MYDLIIMGGGPAAVAAGVYAARKKIHTLLITETFGGQSEVSADIQNWIGTVSIAGIDLARNLEAHLRAQEDITIVTGQKVEKVAQGEDKIFMVSTNSGVTYRARTLIVGTGARRRTLNVPGESEMNGKGVAYCATCDAPLFKGKVVVVVGGGNAGLESAVDLLPYASKIYLLERGEVLRGDPITQSKIIQGGVEVIYHAQTARVVGEQFVKGLEYIDLKTNTPKLLDVQGVFVEIGSIPNSDMVADLVTLNKMKEVVIDHKNSATSREGIWAAGDVTDEAFKQNNISAGDGVKAALAAYAYLQNLGKEA